MNHHLLSVVEKVKDINNRHCKFKIPLIAGKKPAYNAPFKIIKKNIPQVKIMSQRFLL